MSYTVSITQRTTGPDGTSGDVEVYSQVFDDLDVQAVIRAILDVPVPKPKRPHRKAAVD